MRQRPLVLLLAFPLLVFPLLLAGCAKKQEPAPPTEAAATPVVEAPPAEAAPTTAGDPELVAVDLPDAFPTQFPLVPAGTVTEASASRDGNNVEAQSTTYVKQDAAALFAWYKQALPGAGWRVDTEGQSGTSRSLHAVQGESSIDLTVDPDGEHPGWSVARVGIHWVGGAAQ